MDENLMDVIVDHHWRSQQALIDSDYEAAAAWSDRLRETIASDAIEPVILDDGQ